MSWVDAIAYDDDWIFANWKQHKNWKTLHREYDKVHQTNINHTTFRSHCNRELGLNYSYTDEQIQWLKDNYPSLGYKKTAELFNKTFNANRTTLAIKLKCGKLGLEVTEERIRQRTYENIGMFVHPIGAEVIKQNGEIYIKTKDGYIRKKNLVYGEIPKGSVLVHLDGDPKNCNKENLMPMSRQHLALMTINDFWSNNPEITKTGARCCDLAIILKERRINDSLRNKSRLHGTS